jgi:hypothetical protein
MITLQSNVTGLGRDDEPVRVTTKVAPIDTRTPPYVRQTFPGQPIELLWGNEPPLQISDSSALLLAHLLTQFVLGNIQAQARVKHGD